MTRFGQALVQYVVPNTGNAPVQVLGEQAGATANTTSQASALFDGLWYHTATRSGSGVAGRIERLFGSAPLFHALLDPTTPAVPFALVLEDIVSAVIVAGACEGYFGFFEHITAATANTLVGVGFLVGPDHVWHSFVNDCPGNALPVTVRRNQPLAGKLSTASHRLTLVIDGLTKTIIWKIDGVEVDRWIPPAALDQMGTTPGPKMGYGMVVPAAGNATIRMHAGGGPQLRAVF